jgi:hypothetical protein
MATKKTQEEILAGFKAVHSDRYDYSQVEYKNAVSKIKIICPKHGLFEQTPNSHLTGSGCYECGILRIRELKVFGMEKVLAEFRKVHGNRYDYSRVQYFNSHKKVDIICQEHGVFKQSPDKHLAGQGCPECGGHLRLRNNDLIDRFVKIHGDKYDYSLIE